jgi:hypothetical protein
MSYQNNYGWPAPYRSHGIGRLSGDESGKVYVTWKAPAVIGLFSGAGWDVKQQRLGNLLAQRGYDVVSITWDWASYVPVSYNLVIHAYLPQGVDAAESVLADLAEQAGFSVDRSAISFQHGGQPSPGDGGNDDKKPDNTMLYVAGAALLLVLVMRGR